MSDVYAASVMCQLQESNKSSSRGSTMVISSKCPVSLYSDSVAMQISGCVLKDYKANQFSDVCLGCDRDILWHCV